MESEPDAATHGKSADERCPGGAGFQGRVHAQVAEAGESAQQTGQRARSQREIDRASQGEPYAQPERLAGLHLAAGKRPRSRAAHLGVHVAFDVLIERRGARGEKRRGKNRMSEARDVERSARAHVIAGSRR